MAITAGAAGGNWSAGGTWVGGIAPTATDDVILASTSGNVTVDTTTCVCKTLSCTTTGNYAGTLTFTSGQKLTVSGSVTFASTMTISGTGKLAINAAATLTSAGKTLSGDLDIGTSATKTFADAWAISGSITAVQGAINGFSLTVSGGVSVSGNVFGSTTLTLNGTGTLSATSLDVNVRWFAGAITINTAGTITLGSSFNYGSAGDFTLTAGTFDCLTNSSTFLAIGGFSFKGNNITFYNLVSIPAITTDTYTLGLKSGNTYTVNNVLQVIGTVFNTGRTHTIQATTASSSAFLNFKGTIQNCLVSGAIMTDIDASGSDQPILNFNGGTLTRCKNIYNKTLGNQLTGPSKVGMVYTSQGQPENVTWV